MEVNFLSNNEIGDFDLLNQLRKYETELSETKSQLSEKTRLYLDQKHQFEDLFIETKDLKEKYSNQQNLLKFYEEKVSNDISTEIENDPIKKDKIKQLEIKLMNLNEKIKEFEELIIKKDNEIEVLAQDLQEEKEISNKALDMIDDKDEEIKELKEKYENDTGPDLKRKISSSECNLSPEEIQELREILFSQEEEFDSYKETAEKKIKEYADDNNNLYNEIKELKDKITLTESENIKLKERNDILEKEKIIDQAKIEEKNEIEDTKENDYISEIQYLHALLEESNRKNIEMEEKQKKEKKYERNEYEKIINELYKNNTNLEKELENIKKELNKKENEIKLKISEYNNIKNKETDFKTNISTLEKQINEKDSKFNEIKIKLEERDNQLKKVIEDKDKKINELTKKYEKENNNYVKKIRDLNTQLKSAMTELNELKNKNNGTTLDEMLGDSSEQDVDQNSIEKLKEEIKYYEQQIEELKKDKIKAKRADELEAKNNFLNNTIEIMKKNIEELKTQKRKVEDDLKAEIIKVQNNLGQIKLELATSVYEKDMQLIRYRRYTDKLKDKLISLGYKFKEKSGKS